MPMVYLTWKTLLKHTNHWNVGYPSLNYMCLIFTSAYLSTSVVSGTKEKRIALENALQAVRKSMTDFEKCCSEDVIFDLVDLDLVPIGEGFNVCVKVQVSIHFCPEVKLKSMSIPFDLMSRIRLMKCALLTQFYLPPPTIIRVSKVEKWGTPLVL